MFKDVTQILVRIDSGDRAAIDELLPKVYENLRSMARQRMAQERCEHTLQATALVNEAYLRLVNPKSTRLKNNATPKRRAFGGPTAVGEMY